MESSHPCGECPALADRGRIACPVAGAVLNKHRCKRVKRMPSAQAMANLARAGLDRWRDAKGTGNRPMRDFLRWHAAGRELSTARVLAPLTGREQVKTLAAPVVARRVQRANGAAPTAPDTHVIAQCDDVRPLWERSDGQTRKRTARGRSPHGLTGKG